MFKILSMFLFYFFLICSINLEAQNASVKRILHTCPGANEGLIEMQILGNPNSFTYWWEHGPTELTIADLASGVYTLVVQDNRGCRDLYPVEIVNVEQCLIKYEITSGKGCIVFIDFTVSINGNPISDEGITANWTDTPINTIDRYFDTRMPSMCVDINVAELCCNYQHCFNIPRPVGCGSKGEKVIVNEYYSKGAASEDQFVELLVVGNGECGDNFDLSGYLLDDNNGELIPGNEFVNENSNSEVGIDMGYLAFKYLPSWEMVPNGSLIVIYKSRNGNLSIPPDDPKDSNQDGVYVLSANNDSYLIGYSGQWNYQKSQQDYVGTLIDPSWDLININDKNDGLQVRNPLGEYVHGVSSGSSLFMGNNFFDLWISSASTDDPNCKFIKDTIPYKSHYRCDQASQSLETPGLSNSTMNEDFIVALQDCIGGEQGLRENNEQRENEFINQHIKIFPNPTNSKFNVMLTSNLRGKGKVSVLTVQGKGLMTIPIKFDSNVFQKEILLGNTVPPGLFIVKVLFPDGQIQTRKVVKISNQ